MNIQIPGLPEGVECVRIGTATADDYEITNSVHTDDPPSITKGPRIGSATQIIVRPAAGWEFRFDIRTLSFRLVKKLDTPLEITRTVKFVVSNALDQGIVEDRLDSLKDLPGWTE